MQEVGIKGPGKADIDTMRYYGIYYAQHRSIKG